jgi:hypothetical protein
LDVGLTTLLCKNITIVESKAGKTGCNLAEFSKEGCGSERDVLPHDYDDDDELIRV